MQGAEGSRNMEGEGEQEHWGLGGSRIAEGQGRQEHRVAGRKQEH